MHLGHRSTSIGRCLPGGGRGSPVAAARRGWGPSAWLGRGESAALDACVVCACVSACVRVRRACCSCAGCCGAAPCVCVAVTKSQSAAVAAAAAARPACAKQQGVRACAVMHAVLERGGLCRVQQARGSPALVLVAAQRCLCAALLGKGWGDAGGVGSSPYTCFDCGPCRTPVVHACCRFHAPPAGRMHASQPAQRRRARSH